MPRINSSFAKKRKFCGNKFVECKRNTTNNDCNVHEANLSTPNNNSEQPTCSSSSKKLSFENYEQFVTSGSGNCVFEVQHKENEENQDYCSGLC
jgi:4-diphosphocytidyl-2C-methyl-D-erythritol kinase